MTVQEEIDKLIVDAKKYDLQGLNFVAEMCRVRIEYLKGDSDLQKMSLKSGTKIKGVYIADFLSTAIGCKFKKGDQLLIEF